MIHGRYIDTDIFVASYVRVLEAFSIGIRHFLLPPIQSTVIIIIFNTLILQVIGYFCTFIVILC
jgi:hypothetical protein